MLNDCLYISLGVSYIHHIIINGKLYINIDFKEDGQT
jgi:hypothetical protein